MYGSSGTLKATPPFDLAKSIMFLEKFKPMGGEQELHEGTITKAMMVNGQTILFMVKQSGTIDDPIVKFELTSIKPLTKALREDVSRRISSFLSLEDDLKPFYEIARKKDPKFYPVVERLWGFHHVRFSSLLEIASWAILAQHTPLKVAQRMKHAIIEEFGGNLDIDGNRHWAFPDYSHLKRASFNDLSRLFSNTRRAEYLCSFLRAYENLDQNYLLNADFDEAKATLLKIKGIGEWSATFILSRGLGRMERFPENLKSIVPEASLTYGHVQSFQRIKTVYGRTVGYWLLYLWASRLSRA